MDAARIGVARLRSRDADARAAMGRMASALDFRVAGVSTSAILVMRSVRCRMRKPLRRVADDLREIRAVEMGVLESIARSVGRAARPGRGDVDESAEAVYFDDLADFLACLVRDWLAGRVASRWWWRSVLPSGSAEREILEHCRRSPEWVPASLGQLAKTSDAVAFVARIRHADAVDLVERVANAFAIESGLATGPPRRAEAPDRNAMPPAVAERVRAALPECAASALERPAVALLALGLGLQRVPALLRRFSLLDVVDAIARAEGPAAGPRPTEGAGTRTTPEHVKRDASTATEPPATEGRAASAAGASSEARSPAATSSRARHAPSFAPPDAVAIRGDASPAAGGERREQDGARPERPPPGRAPVPPEQPEGLAPMSAEAESIPFECATRFGGIAYLLNVALHFGLYGDFTQPRAPGLALSPWDLLAACGRSWFGEEFVADPAWEMLASLAGREGEAQPGEGFIPPHDPPDFDAWLANLLPRLEARIALALGAEDAVEAIATLVRSEARMVSTPTRLDVHVPLSALPLAVRYAGLDRDPGWIPAAGRFVAFHFA